MNSLPALIVSSLICSSAFAVNGANDAPVIPAAPSAPPVPQTYLPPTPTAAPASTVPALPIDTPAPATAVAPASDAGKSGENPLAPLLQSLGGMGGGGGAGRGGSGDGRGGDRSAGGDDGGGGAPAGTDPSSGVEYTGGGMTERGGQVFKDVAGCSTQPGKFQFIYGQAGGACSSGRDGKLKMSETLSSFLDRNLNRCVGEAVGASTSGGKIYHAGTIGDARHQQTGSLHNVGLAIDVKAIQANGQTFVYDSKDARSQTFFAKFRDCWGKAANSERLGCLRPSRKGKAPGTIGDEDPHHQHHMHLSVPLCPAEARAKGLYLAMTGVWSALVPRASAQEDTTTTRRVVKLDGNARAELVVQDQHGEPVDAPLRFTVKTKCANEKTVRTVLNDEGGCEYVAFTPKGAEVELRYLISAMNEGELICKTLVVKTYRPACGKAK